MYIMTTNIVCVDGVRVTVYGISTIDGKDSFPDIGTDKTAVKNFVALCNQMNVETVHLKDVVEDFCGMNQ